MEIGKLSKVKAMLTKDMIVVSYDIAQEADSIIETA